jgi:hypothetical protein
MHWVIQNNLYQEAAYDDLKKAIYRSHLEYTEVQVIPFSHEITPMPTAVNPIVVMGSYSLCLAANKLGWSPGAFMNDNFDHTAYSNHYAEHLLNSDATVCPLGEVPDNVDEPVFFMRPLDDSKSFAGMIVDIRECESWIEKIQAVQDENYTTLRTDTQVVVAPIKHILREYRFFVVGGKVITGSLYKMGGRVTYQRCVDDADQFAQEMADTWCPDNAFVLDIALTEEGYKVIEINCMNAAGYYACDVSKIIQAVEELMTP